MAKHSTISAWPTSVRQDTHCACGHQDYTHDAFGSHCLIEGCPCRKLRTPLPVMFELAGARV